MKTLHIIIIAVAFILGVTLSGGIYDLVNASPGTTDDSAVLYKINRFTGKVWRINGVGQQRVTGED